VECATCRNKVCRDGTDCTGRRDEIAAFYDDPETARIASVAAEIEARYYGEMCRLEEIIEFARRMNYERIGIAFCVGLSEEAERLAAILAKHFEVSTVCCKVCGIEDDSFRELKESKGLSRAVCNPVGQAELLNSEHTDLNIILGLCIGHDILFTRYSKAPVTTLVVKDRVLAHNTAGAIYSRYVRRRIEKRYGRKEEVSAEKQDR